MSDDFRKDAIRQLREQIIKESLQPAPVAPVNPAPTPAPATQDNK